MPTFRNTTARSKTLIGGTNNRKRYSLKKYTTSEIDFYPASIPDGVTFIDHMPIIHPYEELAALTEFPSDEFDCYGFEYLLFHNATDEAVTIYTNSDATTSFDIPPDSFLTMEANGLWGCMVVESGGVGTFKVWGIR